MYNSDTAILMSIQPKWCGLIASGKKTLEVRKTKPKKLVPPFRCYIYESGSRKQVIGEFVCDEITTFPDDCPPSWVVKNSCATVTELMEYTGDNDSLYIWHISDLKIYDEPKELRRYGLFRPPQSWCYVGENTKIHLT